VSHPFVVSDSAAELVIRVKAVPGAKSDSIVGMLGERLKVRVAAPPEGGRANRAIERLIAAALGVAPRSVSVVAGAGSAEKQVRIEAPPAGAPGVLLGRDSEPSPGRSQRLGSSPSSAAGRRGKERPTR